MSKPFKVWYKDNVGLTNMIIYAGNQNAAYRLVDEFYKAYRIVKVVEV